jgi:phosphoribosylformylglycinamidine synthase
LLVGAGEENAGLVDIGDGLAIAFKIESHNHPSAVEPYQGAATGVGGILRDIFSMGARPIAALNSLRFGTLDDPRVRYLFKHVVKGIGDYGNSFGVPTVGGEVYFDASYAGNPLVNAMAVGVVAHSQVAKASAPGAGNSVMIVGSSTGRDGIHGATFASEEISEASEAKRPSVQVGDPFTEKLLLEATLEAIQTGFVVGIQDMGAAGITCSTSEMSAKSKTGMSIDLEHVPLRESGMTAYEIMLSESQERMLFIVQKGHEDDVNKVFHKWDLHAEIIGVVEADQMLTVHVNGKKVACIDPEPLVLGGGAPVYEREVSEPAYLAHTRDFSPDSVSIPSDLSKTLLEMISRPNIASKRWVYEQYDSMVRTNSLSTTGGDAAVIRLKNTDKRIALSTDCNGRYVYLNPRVGAQIAVAESARNVVCVGARPVAITNCLNFGNPYDPEIYWQFTEAVGGIGDACRALETPVTGGNVSFYNENPQGSVFPTPVIGMLGVFDEGVQHLGLHFRDPGDIVLLLGPLGHGIEGSEYLSYRTGENLGDCPALSLENERLLQQCVLALNEAKLLKSAHDVSDGGLAVALGESCIGHSLTGIQISLESMAGLRADEALFGEAQSRIVVSCDPDMLDDIKRICREKDVELRELGVVTKDDKYEVDDIIQCGVEELAKAHSGVIQDIMNTTL